MSAAAVATPACGAPLLTYRPDVDGLRGVAISAVVLFHAHCSGAGGGFAGVDVFFVISGFLIATWVEHLAARRADWVAEFYRRRILRLLPAATVLIVLIFPLTVWLLIPLDLEAFGRSVTATSLLSANVFFWHEAGYFASPSATKPLLHMWSLAVEQQFYLLYPVVVLAAKRLRISLVQTLAALLATSLAFCLWTTIHNPGVAFYWTPLRLWELLLGSLLALRPLPLPASRGARSAIAWAGIAMIITAVMALDRNVAWPGYAAALPCLGTALLIWVGQDRTVRTIRILGWRPLAGLGLISYSLYLWHWPLLALARYWKIEALAPSETTAVVILGLALSAASWRWVEQPARNAGRHVSSRRVFVSAAVALTGVAGLGAAAFLEEGWPGRIPDYGRYLAARADRTEPKCPDKTVERLNSAQCALGSGDATEVRFIVWGDSHAGAVSAAFDEIGRQLGWSGRLATSSGCPPLIGDTRAGRQHDVRCPQLRAAMNEMLKPGMTIFLVAYWNRYLYGGLRAVGQPEGETPDAIATAQLHVEIESRLRETLRDINRHGAHAVMLGPMPEFAAAVPDLLLRRPGMTRIAAPLVERRSAYTIAMLERLASEEGATYLDLLPALCDHKYCYGALGTKVLFWDDDHLSKSGARYLIPTILPAFKTKFQHPIIPPHENDGQEADPQARSPR